MTPEERGALNAVWFATDQLRTALARCETAGLSDMNVEQPLREALVVVLGVRDVIEGMV